MWLSAVSMWHARPYGKLMCTALEGNLHAEQNLARLDVAYAAVTITAGEALADLKSILCHLIFNHPDCCIVG